VLAAAVRREVGLEPLDLLAENERACSQPTSERDLEFLLQRIVLSFERHEGDRARMGLREWRHVGSIVILTTGRGR